MHMRFSTIIHPPPPSLTVYIDIVYDDYLNYFETKEVIFAGGYYWFEHFKCFQNIFISRSKDILLHFLLFFKSGFTSWILILKNTAYNVFRKYKLADEILFQNLNAFCLVLVF